MSRRPPRSPLFPSTTLSRSGRSAAAAAAPGSAAASVALQHLLKEAHAHLLSAEVVDQLVAEDGEEERLDAGVLAKAAARSEEHTSELQSQSNLVCRPLVEKKGLLREPHGFGSGVDDRACTPGPLRRCPRE